MLFIRLPAKMLIGIYSHKMVSKQPLSTVIVTMAVLIKNLTGFADHPWMCIFLTTCFL